MSQRFRELDGLRIVAATLVLLSHLVENAENHIPGWLAPFLAGDIAVLVFFVLSGFVITRLLVGEMGRTGSISLWAFYWRRSMRIWPASYAYIAVATACAAWGLAELQTKQIILVSAHMWNYGQLLIHQDLSSQGHAIFGHFWSLALEEQFYWTWPLALLALRGHAAKVLIGVILIMPVIRVASYAFQPGLRSSLGMMLHTGIDPIAMGALLALGEARVKPHMAKVRPVLFHANLMFLFIACPLLVRSLHVLWAITYGRTLESASAALLIAALAFGPETSLARLLRTQPFQFGGRISYSLYVWQQLFSLPRSIFPMSAGAAIVFARS
eukprot:gene15545-15692_t